MRKKMSAATGGECSCLVNADRTCRRQVAGGVCMADAVGVWSLNSTVCGGVIKKRHVINDGHVHDQAAYVTEPTTVPVAPATPLYST